MEWADWETITVQGRDFAVMVEPDAAMRAPFAALRREATERAAALSMGTPAVGVS